jgi:hypothetical protein
MGLAVWATCWIMLGDSAEGRALLRTSGLSSEGVVMLNGLDGLDRPCDAADCLMQMPARPVCPEAWAPLLTGTPCPHTTFA